MKLRFRPGEVVDVKVTSDVDDCRSMLAGEGVVHEISGPNANGSGWTYLVWVEEPEPERRVLWVCDESELTATGVVEAAGGARVPVAGPPAELDDEISLRLITAVTHEGEARGVADRAIAAVRELAHPAEVSLQLDRHWHAPHHYEVLVSVRPYGDALRTFAAIVASCTSGWVSKEDDGWRCDFWWSRDSADENAAFIASEVHDAAVNLSPWSSPSRRADKDPTCP